MIDAIFYDEANLAPEIREEFPDWLLAVGAKIQADLLRVATVNTSRQATISSFRDYVMDRSIRLLEPIQVSVLYEGQFLYHDWRPEGSRVEQVAGEAYAFFVEVTKNRAQVLTWKDHTANNVHSVERMERTNVALIARLPVQEVVLVVEMHWGPGFDRFKRQVRHLQDLVLPVRVQIADATEILIADLRRNPAKLDGLGAKELEDIVENRLLAMGFRTIRAGHTYAADGGIDIVFLDDDSPIPYVGAVQVKSHRSRDIVTGVDVPRSFWTAFNIHPDFALGILVTNTQFSPDARALAKKLSSRIRLRERKDLLRWIDGRFIDKSEWRELPTEIELRPGVRIQIPRGGV